MNYSKYSKESFNILSNDTQATKKLANSLQDDVLEELNKEILKAFEKVASKLNEEGHKMEPFVENSIGEYEYREIDKNGNCSLRLACDVIISSGYKDIIK